MDDVTISRTYPATNFGSEPFIVIDMLEGDAALLRFDLSAVGAREIKGAVLQLTAHEDDGVSHAGVYYIQPLANGWTEDTVTYDTVPKADGVLFASVATQNEDNQYMLDVTNAAANHIIGFRIIGTDRVRTAFSSKESPHSDDAPVLLVQLESSSSSSATVASSSTSSTTTESSHIDSPVAMSESEPTVPQEQAAVEEVASITMKGNAHQHKEPSSSEVVTNEPVVTIISGRIWHDKNFDGVQNELEPGLRGILVDLYKCSDDQWLGGTRTVAGGDYIFEELEDGQYYVVVTVSTEYSLTEQHAGSDDTKDSDVDPATGRSDCIELSSSAGKLAATVSAGIGRKRADIIAEESSTTNDPDTNTGTEEESTIDNCRGRACPEGEGYCRSKYNFCGTGDEYCNEESQWTSECGTPLPTDEPSAAPTTAQPTFVYDPDVHCSGEPCTEGDGTWCRSEIGYCGSGSLYCNSYSVWMPDCNSDGSSSPAPTDAPTTSSGTHAPTTFLEETNSPTRGAGSQLGFSPFALPTLSEIDAPDMNAIAKAKMQAHSKSTTRDQDEQTPVQVDESEESASNTQAAINQARNSDAEDWYIRYSDSMKPISRNAGPRAPLERLTLLSIAFITALLYA